VATLGTSGADEGVFGRGSGKTWVALAGAGEPKTSFVPFGGRDEYTVVRIGNQALILLWNHLTG
jgi:hypothetical protein